MMENVAVIPLTQGRLAIVDAEMAPLLGRYSWSFSKVAGSPDPTFGYAMTNLGAGVRTSMHRFISATPPELSCDHINGDPLDNRRANLRNITHAENLRNRRVFKNNQAGTKYVRHDPKTGLWRVSFSVAFEAREDAETVARHLATYVQSELTGTDASQAPPRLTAEEVMAVWERCGRPDRAPWQRRSCNGGDRGAA